MTKTAKSSADYILPLYMSGLSGRMLKLPAPFRRRRDILLIAGHHTSIERILGIAEYLNKFGGVTSPDLPGFGGMESLYKINERPNIDILADYLAAFVKFRYRGRRFTVFAVSYGFTVATNMLQRYPEIADKVDLLVSVSGFTHKQDFLWKRANILITHAAAWLCSSRLVSGLVKLVIIRGPIIRGLYRVVEARHPRLKDADSEERKKRILFEIELWKKNDFRTYAAVAVTMFKLDLTNSHVKLPVYHVAVGTDHYFNQILVEQHMRSIYSEFEAIKIKLPSHAPTVLATSKDVEPYVPPRVRRLLRKKV